MDYYDILDRLDEAENAIAQTPVYITNAQQLTVVSPAEVQLASLKAISKVCYGIVSVTLYAATVQPGSTAMIKLKQGETAINSSTITVKAGLNNITLPVLYSNGGSFTIACSVTDVACLIPPSSVKVLIKGAVQN